MHNREIFLESNLQEIASENILVNYGRGRNAFCLRFHNETKVPIRKNIFLGEKMRFIVGIFLDLA